VFIKLGPKHASKDEIELVVFKVLREFLLACNTLPTKAAPPSPSVGASTRTHSTLLTLSSSLRVKGLTRGWYGWWTKAYKLAPPLLN
jgi:hypothetical protein